METTTSADDASQLPTDITESVDRGRISAP